MRAIGHIILFAIIVGMGFAMPVNAQMPTTSYDSTSKLINMCQSGYDTDYGYCAGYITAVADIMQQYELYGLNACPGIGIKSQQLMDNTMGYIARNPDLKGLPAKEAVAHALANLFPCR